MKHHRAILAVSAATLGLCLAIAAPASGAHEVQAAPVSVPASMTPDEVVAARRATFFLSTQAVGQIKAASEEGGDLTRAMTGARMLANWAKVLPSMFPEGTRTEGSHALETVWTDRAGFEARAAAYQQAALEVARVAEEGNREETAKAFMAMAGTCHACHQTYRKE